MSANAITPSMAVIIDNLPDTTIDDYLQGVGNSVGAANITHASRIAGGRVCVFLKTEDAVNSVVADGFLTVKEQFVPIRKYNTAATKIVLSNVFPFITNEQLAINLRKYGTITAPIRDLTTGSRISECAHIKSFRRIAYVLIKDLSVVPDTLTYEIDGQKVTVYLSMDDVVCMRCRTKGHIAKYCKTPLTTSNTSINNSTFASVVGAFPPLKNQSTVTVPLTFSEAISIPSSRISSVGLPVVVVPSTADKPPTAEGISNSHIDASNEVTTLLVKSPTPQQRIDDYNNSHPAPPLFPSPSPPPPLLTLDTETTSKAVTEDEIGKHGHDGEPTMKRCRVESGDGDESDSQSVTSMSSILSNAESMNIDSAEVDDSATCKPIMPPETLKEFLKKSRNFKKILPIVRKYTSDYAALVIELENLIPKQKDVNLKERLKRIIKAISTEADING